MTRVFITIKTYPSISESYTELVCTAGFLEDGSMIRIYPVPYRFLKDFQKYKKYQWIDIDLVKRKKDFRPESYSPKDIDREFILENVVGTENWAERRSIVLKNVYTDMSTLIADAKDPKKHTSLAVLKPKEIVDFYWKSVPKEWDKKKLDKVKANAQQGTIFGKNIHEEFKIVKKLPYEFRYKFVTCDGQPRDLMIEDWEVGMLYWNCLKTCNSEEDACKKVKEKFFDNFKNRDLYFYMGTTLAHHNVSINPFMIIGVFYPPKLKEISSELTLF
jgi:hypothetical protein